MNLSENIKNQLIAGIDLSIAENLISEYENVKTKSFLNDSDNTIKHSGRFAELSMAAIKFIKDGNVIDLNNIEFGKLYDEFEKTRKTTPEDDLLYLAVPRVARAIYTLRSKKKVAHFKLIDPLQIDATYAVTTCDWILASLIFYLHKNDISSDLSSLIQNILKKQIPLIEEFEDGDLLVLEKIDFKEELLLILFKINKRITRKELYSLSNAGYRQIFSTNIRNLKKERLIHENENGLKITSKGIIEVEKVIVKYKK